jgi:phosphatidylglycerol:prolipoprotein diacylglycerol transferase
MIPFPDISPDIFSVNIFGIKLALRWYAVSYILGFVTALQLMKLYLNRPHLWVENEAPFTTVQADAFLTHLILGVILGGRIGYVLFYNLPYYAANPFEILRVWDGGMSFHGGFLGVIIAVITYTVVNRIPLWSSADLIAISSPPGLFFGRLANFINAELWGSPTSVPWGVVFPGEKAQDCFGVVGLCARHPSQIYEALLEGLVLFVFLVLIVKIIGFKLPGLITGVFVFGYGISRFFVEYFRVPDPQFFTETNLYGFAVRFGDLGLTMGQSLTLPMIFLGIALIFNSTKSKHVSKT